MLKSSSLCLYRSNLGTFWRKIEPFWIQDGADGHNFERGPPKYHFSSLVEIGSVVF
jgi:hypothetical protein